MRRQPGFVLVAVLLTILLMSGLGLLVHQQVAATVETSRRVTMELQALSLAQNGIRVGRRLWAAMDAPQLLEGPDRKPGCPGTRDPVDLESARRLDPQRWTAPCDDGFAQESLRRFQRMPGGGYFAFRFSNDRAEEPGLDRNGILLVRSLGLVEDRRCGRPGCGNHLSLVEATLRKEYAFDVLTPFTLAGGRLKLEWPEGEAPVRGPTPWFSLLGPGSAAMAALLREALAGNAGNLPAGPDPVVDANALYQEDPNRSRIFQAGYWAALDEGLRELPPPDPAGPVTDGLHYLAGGGVLGGRYSGVLLVRGDLVVLPGAEFYGLLIHLGSGSLKLCSGARLEGAVWMSDFRDGPDGPQAGELRLQVEPAVTISYHRGVLNRALGLLPPTVLGWRIVFPEME